MTPGSIVRLGWYFVKRLVVRLFGRAEGLPRFRASYFVEDRLLPLDVAEREVLAGASRCIACGACDAAFDAYDRVARTELRGPSDLPLACSRSLPDYDTLGKLVAHLRKGDLAALERVCPVSVPFRKLADVVERRALALAPEEPVAPPPERPRHDPG